MSLVHSSAAKIFKTRHHPRVLNTTFESSEAAIKRGLIVQTSYLSKNEIKAKLKAAKEGDVPQNVGGQECYDADTYRQMQLIKFIQGK